MKSAEAFVVQPQQKNDLEIRVFITDNCPLNPKELEGMIRVGLKVDGWDHVDEKWLTLVVGYNHHTVPINKWLRGEGTSLGERPETFFCQLFVRQACLYPQRCISRMVSLGDANQSVGLGPYRNLPKGQQMDTSAK